MVGVKTDAILGLSPRVRGNRESLDLERKEIRSIPACAGEPLVNPLILLNAMVYPRVCGGTVIEADTTRGCVGLSPRVRGNPSPPGCKQIGLGSIPACAGEPTAVQTSIGKEQVYPRVCGGTTAEGEFVLEESGLSPRVRGNQLLDTVFHHCLRSIPACAGEPRRLYPTITTPPVYPRVCGGTNGGKGTWLQPRGLSPRVRGNL